MANVSRLDSSETTMEMIEIVPRTNSCSFATGRDDSAIFMIIYNHMMKLDILLFGSQWNKNACILWRVMEIEEGVTASTDNT